MFLSTQNYVLKKFCDTKISHLTKSAELKLLVLYYFYLKKIVSAKMVKKNGFKPNVSKTDAKRQILYINRCR